ncbi:MAG: NAD(P)/FAD-dependent oxidoreductase [Bacteroidales bacterium]|nr:NAD(P)/FAD-dependent oxidoreductase [Bacteroidales bacterium]
MKKNVIRGGGIAGLSACCYAQMNGFQTEIYEMNSLPGDVCTSWKRGEFLYDRTMGFPKRQGSDVYVTKKKSDKNDIK